MFCSYHNIPETSVGGCFMGNWNERQKSTGEETPIFQIWETSSQVNASWKKWILNLDLNDIWELIEQTEKKLNHAANFKDLDQWPAKPKSPKLFVWSTSRVTEFLLHLRRNSVLGRVQRRLLKPIAIPEWTSPTVAATNWHTIVL